MSKLMARWVLRLLKYLNRHNAKDPLDIIITTDETWSPETKATYTTTEEGPDPEKRMSIYFITDLRDIWFKFAIELTIETQTMISSLSEDVPVSASGIICSFCKTSFVKVYMCCQFIIYCPYQKLELVKTDTSRCLSMSVSFKSSATFSSFPVFPTELSLLSLSLSHPTEYLIIISIYSTLTYKLSR